jgi:hypothetical protein
VSSEQRTVSSEHPNTRSANFVPNGRLPLTAHRSPLTDA